MKVPPHLMHQKAVAHELCVSLVTLWRARQCNIPGFPQPVMCRNMVFWRRDDLRSLEDALMRFEGRAKFEEKRDRCKRIAALTKAHPKPKRIRRAQRSDERQRDLF